MKHKVWVFLFLIISLAGCQVNYQPERFSKYIFNEYYNENPNRKVDIQFNPLFLSESNNKSFLSTLKQNLMNLILIRIKNNSDQPLLVSKYNLKYVFDEDIYEFLNRDKLDQLRIQRSATPALLYTLGISVINPILGVITGVIVYKNLKNTEFAFKYEIINNYVMGRTIPPYSETIGYLAYKGNFSKNIEILFIDK